MDKIVALAKSRGFIYPGSEIYGGLANTWDYGPLGVLLKNNIKKAWWQKFIQESEYNTGVESAILMNPKVWETSGHIGNFSDPLMDCKECKERFRADKIIEEYINQNNLNENAEVMSHDEMKQFIDDNKIPCPTCGANNFTEIRNFNLMFKTYAGVTEDTKNIVYLRPETAQGIFINFKNVQRTTRKKIPFGIGQIGKSFRNEITPGNFTFRTREFEQLELEFFCKPGSELEWFKYWKEFCFNWLKQLNIKEQNISFRDHDKEELSHYSNATTDIEYNFPFGKGELWGIASRTDFDLKKHSEATGETLEYFDPITNEKYIPYCIEPSLGADRVTLAFLCDAYNEEELKDDKGNIDTRVVLKFHNAIAPIKAAILPLSKKLSENAFNLYKNLSKYFECEYDDTASIGKRYRRQDEIGTPFCITYDFESEVDGCVTVRYRDTMEQERININNLKSYIEEKIQF